MIVVDASVLIAFLDGEDGHHAAAETLLAQAIEDDLGVSSLARTADKRNLPVLRR